MQQNNDNVKFNRIDDFKYLQTFIHIAVIGNLNIAVLLSLAIVSMILKYCHKYWLYFCAQYYSKYQKLLIELFAMTILLS